MLSCNIFSDIELLFYLLWTLDNVLYFISFLSHPFIRVTLIKESSLWKYFTVRFILTDFEWLNAILLF